ncbi:Intramolecular chaperone auto-processing domain containing protein [uncultured Caudovirales phage]|uniref:Intramolecular chaperone auto-processing domain containing protein n=1 Tax=uncultured Caudovirales phage TaxID=2100421 RepID=A0A6J7XCX9_9CAUD|nr:Intramolecular chaperone auto-processing domain containing protein [uncultured Caudovirales phage]
MANTVKMKRSATPAKVPTTSDIDLGEIAINTYDGKMYIKKDNGTASIVQVGAGGSGSGNVVGPASSTDNALVRFDGTTGELIQNSNATLSDAGTLNVLNINTDYVQIDTAATPPTIVEGTLAWNVGEGTADLGLKGGNVTYQLGEQEFCRVYNDQGSTITKGQVVYISGAQGNRVAVKLAQANTEINSRATIGLVAETMASGVEGWVQVSGKLPKLNTTGLTEGDPLYLSPTTAGGYTQTRPTAPDNTVILGWVERVSATVGSIYIKVDNGYELDELHNVLINSPTNGDTLVYNTTVGVWENSTITAGDGISVTNGAGTITIANTGILSLNVTSPIETTGTDNPTISLSSGYGDLQNPYGSKSAANFLASPVSASGIPTFRAINATDIPTLNQNTTGTAGNITATSNSTLTTLSALNLPYSQLSGSVPTWNQDTTGTASNITATTNNTLTTLSSLSLPYSQLSGIVPTWNQNTTGTAANVSGIVAVANGGTNATDATTARSNLSAAKSGSNTDITSIALSSGTITSAPVNNTDIVNKQYADAIASGIHFHEAVSLATTAALPANTYNNGTSGVGATLTANANGALSVDSTLTVTNERILVKNQANGAQNGVYVVTQVGSAGTPYILTRATDFDSVGNGVDQIDEGDFFLVTNGVANLNTAWVQQTAPPITIGTTAIVFQQFSAPITYTAGTGLNESPAYTFNISSVGTAGTYGSASSVPVFVTNAQGQVTSVTNTAIAISGSAVSGNIAGNAAAATNLIGTNPSGPRVVFQSGTDTTGFVSANNTTVSRFLRQIGDGTTAFAPSFSTLTASDIPTLNQNTTGTAGNVTGIVAVANGGTGQSSSNAASLIATTGYTATAASGGNTVLTATSTYYQIISGASAHTYTLPVNSTLSLGFAFSITNISAFTITVNSSAGAALYSILPNTTMILTCTSTSVATGWVSATSTTTTGQIQLASFGVGTAPSGTAGEIRATNNVTAYFTSDKKYKENIRAIPSALPKVLQIGGKLFDWTDEYIANHGGEDNYFVRKSDFGVIAQDVQEVFDVAVRTKQDGTLAVDYEKMCALAFAAIKELNQRIVELEQKVK